jgi:hypothetical protein
MPGYKEPGFQERVAAAARAKQSALAGLRSKPPVDDATRAEQAIRREAREAAAAAKREAAQLAKAQARAAKAERAQQTATIVKPTAEARAKTEAELKAARDLRYAARKSRKS